MQQLKIVPNSCRPTVQQRGLVTCASVTAGARRPNPSSTATVHITHSVVQCSIGPPSSGSQATNYNRRFGSFTSFNLVLAGPRNISHICIICISCNCPRAHISILSLRDGRHERRFFTLQNMQLMNKFITRRILINTCSSSLAS